MTKHLTINDYHKFVDQIKREITRRDERIRRLLIACHTWEEKSWLTEEALKVACEEMEAIADGCVYFDITGNGEMLQECDNNCEVCLKAYFLRQGQANCSVCGAGSEVGGGKGCTADDEEKCE